MGSTTKKAMVIMLVNFAKSGVLRSRRRVKGTKTSVAIGKMSVITVKRLVVHKAM